MSILAFKAHQRPCPPVAVARARRRDVAQPPPQLLLRCQRPPWWPPLCLSVMAHSPARPALCDAEPLLGCRTASRRRAGLRIFPSHILSGARINNGTPLDLGRERLLAKRGAR
jgi:hypothetical protein